MHRQNGFVSQNALFGQPQKWRCFAKMLISASPENGFVSQNGLFRGSKKMGSFRKTPLFSRPSAPQRR
jgi:hypothetical protein